MHGVSPTDPGVTIDWDRTSNDYLRFRPGYPESFWRRIVALGIGQPGQRVLDLGTGTGNLAIDLARRGCSVAGIDLAAGQVEEARRRAEREKLPVDFRVGPAEATGLPGGSFDVVTASQCWLYFDKDRVIPEVKRLLAPGGKLVTCHLCWLPRRDRIARETEALVLEHNPKWTANDCSGDVPAIPAWAVPHFRVAAMFFYDEPVTFTRETWRGRIRACRGIGAALDAGAVRAFDAELDALLKTLAGDEFTILHRIDAHVFEPLEPTG
jgi:SAM-dependent methyltransferase